MEQHGISKLDLKRQNRMQVLKLLKQKGPTSRIDIAKTLELTRAAVTIISNEMIEQGIICEIGEYKHINEKAPRGRKKILIDINHNYKFVIGCVIEEELVGVGLATLAGEVLDKRNMKIKGKITYQEIIDFIHTAIDEILVNNCLEVSSILGVGIGILPSMNEMMGIKTINSSIENSDLAKDIKSIINLPIVIDNAVKGTAMANIDFQKEKDPNRHNIAFLQYGENFNFVVTNLNDPIVSYDNRTSFVDNIIVNPFSEYSPKGTLKRGSVKAELSPKAILNKLHIIYSKEETPNLYSITSGDPNNIRIEMLRDSQAILDQKVKDLSSQLAELMCVLINNLEYSTNPQKLVLHDFRLSEKEFMTFKTLVEKMAGKEVAKIIDLSIIEERNRFLGGAALAIRELFFTRGGYDVSNK